MKFFDTNKKLHFRSELVFSLFCMFAAFITYCSMYAFRKPFTAGTYVHLSLWGIDYKIILITTQVFGYMLSKFIGIRVISEMSPHKRIMNILGLIGIAWAALFLFGITPYPYNCIWLFVNGLPLGMIWGLVFAFLEGRRNTELLGAAMSISFIVASGLVKAVGKYLITDWGVAEFWMPFGVGLIFILPLLLGVWMLGKMPPPSPEDIALRTERVPMNKELRKAFFKTFAPGIILLIIVYISLTIFRELRDNFAVEIWSLLGYPDMPQVLLTAEIPIAVGVFAIIGAMIFIKDNRKAFYANIGIVLLGGLLLISATALFQAKMLHPAAWMILAGFAMYLSYVSFHTMLFERWIALFQYKSNIGFLMYITDAFGYLGSVGVLFYKNFGTKEQNWLTYITYVSYIVGAITVISTAIAFFYFRNKEITLGLRKPLNLAQTGLPL